MAHTNSWDETSPTDTTLATTIDDEIRKVRIDIRERMAVDHNLTASDDGSGDEGLHKKVTLEDKIASPTLASNQSVIYCKTDDDDGELRYKDKRGLDSLISFIGEIRMRMGTTVPTGWLALNGDSIGNTGSGATHAGTDYEGLYVFLWNELADSEFTITGGRGASAAADWAGAKKGTMPDARSRLTMCAGTGAGLTARTIGDASLGAETIDWTHVHGMNSHVHGMNSHTHSIPGESGYIGAWPDTTYGKDGTSGAATGNTEAATGNTASAGSATQNIMNPFIVVAMLIRY